MSTDPSTGYYEWLDFNSPMSEETAVRLVGELVSFPPARILDVGCGWGEFLLRLLAESPGTVGRGIDRDAVLLERARGNTVNRELDDRVVFVDTLDGAEPADLVLNVGAEHVFGGLDEALVELWSLVVPGGRLFLGTQFWEAEPTAEVASFIGDLPRLDQLIEHAVVAGWRPLGLTVATPQDWDRFEFGFLADWEQVAMSVQTPEAVSEARRAADEHRRGYLQRRGTLGFAYLTLGRPLSA